jgi:hypothetical protein
LKRSTRDQKCSSNSLQLILLALMSAVSAVADLNEMSVMRQSTRCQKDAGSERSRPHRCLTVLSELVDASFGPDYRGAGERTMRRSVTLATASWL